MAKLTTAQRDRLKPSDFALPSRIHKGKRGAKITRGAYPIENAAHARDALGRARKNEKRRTFLYVARKVKRRYPSIHVAALDGKR